VGPIGIQWPIHTFLLVNYTPGPDCYCTIPNGTVVRLVWDSSVPNNTGGFGAWFSDVYMPQCAFTQLNAGAIPGRRYGSFDRVNPTDCLPVKFQVTCGNGFAPNMFLWIYYVGDYPGNPTINSDFSPQVFDQWTSCWPLLTAMDWPPQSVEIWQTAHFTWYQ
jgi:hypothetical protein